MNMVEHMVNHNIPPSHYDVDKKTDNYSTRLIKYVKTLCYVMDGQVLTDGYAKVSKFIRLFY